MSVSILIMHQSATDAEQLKVLIEEMDLQTHLAVGAEKACEIIRVRRPGLILLDADMLLQQPDLCGALRRCCPEIHLPIILLIPQNSPHALSRYLCGTGADDYISQPYSVEEVQSRIMLRLSAGRKKKVQLLPDIDFSYLAGLSKLAVSELDSTEILQQVIASISEVIEIRRCSITMVREDDEFGYVLASSDDLGVNGLQIELERYPEIQETIRTGRPLLIDNICKHPLMEPVLPYIEQLGFNSILVLPMIDRQRIVGVLVLRTARSITGFTEEEISFCQLVANVATSALRLAELRRAENTRVQTFVPAELGETDEQGRRDRSSLLRMAAHDLRVLVSVIDGYCMLLTETGEDNLTKEQHEIITGLMAGSHRLVDMANNLLDYSRIEAGRFELSIGKENINALMRTVQADLTPLLQRRNIDLQIDCKHPDVCVTCDERSIRRVFYNIVSNALKFTPDGGRIRFTLDVDEKEVRISIVDNGPGIEPQMLSRLFDEYSLGVSPDGHLGSGLGLSICKRIIDAHHGRIWAESSLGQGSCFTFCLPL